MQRRLLLIGLWGTPVLGQALILREPRTFTQNFTGSYLPGDFYASLFLPSLGARRISAIIFSEVRGTAFLDVTNNATDERDIVLGASQQNLKPGSSVLISIPAEFLVFNQVRLRVLNEDKKFGWVRGSLNIWT